jgi:hypothetical protein
MHSTLRTSSDHGRSAPPSLFSASTTFTVPSLAAKTVSRMLLSSV